MTCAIENSCEIWHRRLAHINYNVLPYICKAVTGLPELKVDQERHMQWMRARKEYQELVSEEG